MNRVVSIAVLALGLSPAVFAGPSGHRVTVYNDDLGYDLTVRVWQYDVKRKEQSSFDIAVPAKAHRTEYTANMDTHLIGYSFACNGFGNYYYSVNDDYTSIPKDSLLFSDHWYEKGGMSLRSSAVTDQNGFHIDVKFYPYFTK